MTTDSTQFHQGELREALGAFVTGVTVVTTRDALGMAHGVTANSFSSVSLDPPLVLWSQARRSRSFTAFTESEHFAINILANHQASLANHFARSFEDKFAGVAHTSGLGQVPVLSGVAAHLECVKVAEYPGGDHVIYVGRVERLTYSGQNGLVFGAGQYLCAYAHDPQLAAQQVAARLQLADASDGVNALA